VWLVVVRPTERGEGGGDTGTVLFF
jgi:hypothetical protein